MVIRPLKPYAIHPELSLKRFVVNISIDLYDMLKVLPRKFDHMSTIQIQL